MLIKDLISLLSSFTNYKIFITNKNKKGWKPKNVPESSHFQEYNITIPPG